MNECPNPQGSVSIVVCTYNGAKYLRPQLESILAQTYPIHELIIQDDCSSDGTDVIAKEYAERYPFVHFFPNNTNKGVNENFFSAIARASGEYIAIADQDDIWEPNKIALQIKHIGNHLMCAVRSEPFSEDGSPIRIDKRQPNCHLLRMLYVGGILPGHCLLFRRTLLDKLPDLSDFTAYRCYDIILSITAAAFDDIVYINTTMVHQRRYKQAATYTPPSNNRKSLSNIIRQGWLSIQLYRELIPVIRERFKHTLLFLEQIHSSSQNLKDAIRMCRLQSSTSFRDTLKLSLFCLKHKSKLFYSNEGKGLLLSLRALYFPISSAIYFRMFSRKHKF